MILSYLTHMMSMIDHVTINVETPTVDNECYLEKELTEFIHTNPSIVLHLTVNQVKSCHNCVFYP